MSLLLTPCMIILTVGSRSHLGEPAFRGGSSTRNRSWSGSLLHLLQKIQSSLQVTHSETAAIDQRLLSSGEVKQLLLQGNQGG